ncbi:MAG: TatD family deoxyribonuclease [Verrucomicrobiaceae bacterium]|nr:MAG: TatD family deoxyribonuclease [Verrucomicrobiaceae bacterium]
MLIDSHCHLASHKFSPEEVPELLERAREAGVTRMISLVTSLDDLQPNLKIAENPAVHICIGIHPCDVHHAPDDAVDQLAAFAADPRVCGIGETGLDYFHPAPDGWDEETFRERQRSFLRRHFELAAAAKLNVVIHTRDKEGYSSFEDALGIYGDYHTSVRAVFHCFIGPWENAKRVLELGGLVSFGGVATFKTANEVRDTASQCPAGCFMLETDAPYLAPEPFRGKRNEPAYVAKTAARLAELRGETLESLAAHTGETAAAFFRLRPESV